jgi:hypothetical protein
MSTRSQASCLALFLAIAAICVAFHSQPKVRESSPFRPAALNATVKGALPSSAPVVLYSAEQSSPQPAQKAYARAPFVNVYALYRRGVQEHVRLRSQEQRRPLRSQEPDGEASRHVLLAGQKTA